MKEQSQLQQGEIPGRGKALHSPASRTTPRAAMWTTKSGETHSKVTVRSLMAQAQAHKLKLLWPVPKAVTPEGNRAAAPAA